MAVVMVRVKPSILPPTIITAPTSAAARPKPASSAVDQAEARVPEQRGDAAERPDVHGGELVAIFGPQVLDRLPRQRRDDRRHQDGLRDDHRLRREQEPQEPSGPERDSRRKTARPTTTGGRPISALSSDDDGLAAGKRVSASSAPSGMPISAAQRRRPRGSPAATAARSPAAWDRRSAPGQARTFRHRVRIAERCILVRNGQIL